MLAQKLCRATTFSAVLTQKVFNCVEREVSPTVQRASTPMGGQALADRPYKERGERLRDRRKELQKTGALPSNIDKVAERFGVSRSALQQWERGETWVTQKNRPKLLAALDWTEEELDHGITRAGGDAEMPYHPVSSQELEVLALFRALGGEQPAFIHHLKAKVAAKQAIRQSGAGDAPVADAEVRRRMPVTTKKPQK